MMRRYIFLSVVVLVATSTLCPPLKHFPGKTVSGEDYKKAVEDLYEVSTFTREGRNNDGFFYLFGLLRTPDNEAFLEVLIDALVALIKAGNPQDLAVVKNSLLILREDDLIFRALLSLGKEETLNFLKTNKELWLWWELSASRWWTSLKPEDERWWHRKRASDSLRRFVRVIDEEVKTPGFFVRVEPPKNEPAGASSSAATEPAKTEQPAQPEQVKTAENNKDGSSEAQTLPVTDEDAETSAPVTEHEASSVAQAGDYHTALKKFFTTPSTWFGVSALVPVLGTLRAFYCLKNVEQLLQHGHGWAQWGSTMGLEELKKLSPEEMTNLVIPDIFARRGAKKLFSGDEKIIADFLLEVEQETALLKNYIARFKRIKKIGFGMLFGLDDAMLEKAERGVTRLELVHQKVFEQAVAGKVANSMKRRG